MRFHSSLQSGVQGWGVLPKEWLWFLGTSGCLAAGDGGEWGGKAKVRDSASHFPLHVLHQFCLPFYGPPGGLLKVHPAHSFQVFKNDYVK